MDAAINANPLARKLFEEFQPLARTSFKPLSGIWVDLAYGFLMAEIFLLLYNSLPGETIILKGLSFALYAWFFRVWMNAVSQWVMFKISVKTLLFFLAAGLIEMLLLGVLYGLTLEPSASTSNIGRQFISCPTSLPSIESLLRNIQLT